MKRTLFLIAALAFVLGSVWFSQHLTRQLKVEEQRKVELWAEATRQLIAAEDGTDIDFLSQVIEGNTTIPVYIVSQDGELIDSRNATKKPNFSADAVIEVPISDTIKQYIYYEPSLTLRQLQWYPYIQFFIILIFLILATYAILNTQQNERNMLWAGLSKETAHQLGTPISSLAAWQEILRERYPNDNSFIETEKDIHRLSEVASRFSKIGSQPQLEECDIVELLQNIVSYMQTRTSDKVNIQLSAAVRQQIVNVSPELFSWVIENLLKNAVDAMQGTGNVIIHTTTTRNKTIIDVTDTGSGIEHRLWKKVFEAGYTTKKRGWGLGLSLAKRIVEDYHKGKIFVLNSSNTGTTIRIVL